MSSGGEYRIYFINQTDGNLPNKSALDFHKAACLIWQMAGGAFEDVEECSKWRTIGYGQSFGEKFRRWRLDNEGLENAEVMM